MTTVDEYNVALRELQEHLTLAQSLRSMGSVLGMDETVGKQLLAVVEGEAGKRAAVYLEAARKNGNEEATTYMKGIVDSLKKGK